MARDRFATRALILQSAASIISSGGIPALGVNSLADAAKCDKVLIYRYFGGLEGVLEALGAERMLWPRVEPPSEHDGSDESLAEAVHSRLLEEWAALSSGAFMLASAGAELTGESSALGEATRAQRAELHERMITTLRDKHHVPPYVDLPALVALLSAALTTFALRSAHTPSSTGTTHSFDPGSPQGWRRIEKTLAAVTKSLLDNNGR